MHRDRCFCVLGLRFTAGVNLASTRTRDRRTEARTGPGPLCPRNGKRPPTIQGTCDDTASWPPRRPARGPLREGDGTQSRGLISPSRRMFSSAPKERLIPLVPTRFTGIHVSSPVSSMCLRAKDHLEGTKVAEFPSLCAAPEVQPGSAADWRSPRSGDQEDDGRPGYPKRSRRPRHGRWWDTDRVRPKSALVQAIVVVLHDLTGWGAE